MVFIRSISSISGSWFLFIKIISGTLVRWILTLTLKIS